MFDMLLQENAIVGITKFCSQIKNSTSSERIKEGAEREIKKRGKGTGDEEEGGEGSQEGCEQKQTTKWCHLPLNL